jgi:hypothetical protein
MLHAILFNQKLIGLFSDYDKCDLMIKGLVSNNFVKEEQITIKSYVNNSITEGTYYDCDSDMEMEEFSSVDTTDSSNSSNDNIIPKKVLTNEEIKAKCEIQNNINSLKKEKEKLEEKKRVYDVDVDLYNRFKNILLENANFEIPEMFVDKYNLMKQLDNEGTLSMDEFYKLYQPRPIITSFSKIFE